jgi:hypothetical protein
MVQELLHQVVAVLEMPVEASLGDTQGSGKSFDGQRSASPSDKIKRTGY